MKDVSWSAIFRSRRGRFGKSLDIFEEFRCILYALNDHLMECIRRKSFQYLKVESHCGLVDDTKKQNATTTAESELKYVSVNLLKVS
jgi:hypothetical protein